MSFLQQVIFDMYLDPIWAYCRACSVMQMGPKNTTNVGVWSVAKTMG